ncbi:MAG: ATP-binding protein, partial [Pseudomonadota bacterium]
TNAGPWKATTASRLRFGVCVCVAAALAAQTVRLDLTELGPVLRRLQEIQSTAQAAATQTQTPNLSLDAVVAFQGPALVAVESLPGAPITRADAADAAVAVRRLLGPTGLDQARVLYDPLGTPSLAEDSAQVFWLLWPVNSFASEEVEGTLSLRFHFTASAAPEAEVSGDLSVLSWTIAPTRLSAPTPANLLGGADADLMSERGFWRTVETAAKGGELVGHRSVAIADQAIRLTLTQPVSGLLGMPLLALLPALVLGSAVGVVIYLVSRAERARTDAATRDHRNTLRRVAMNQAALEASEARFKHLAESTNVIPWTADLDTQRFTYFGPQIEDLSGFPATAWYAAGFWAQHVHPHDRSEIRAKLRDMQDGDFETLEYRIRAADGKILHIRNTLTVVKSAQKVGGRIVSKSIAQGFMFDITEMKLAAQTLEEARQKAVEANRVKSEFLANMSHELRTPLNAVIGFSEIMKDEVFGPMDTQYREYAESIYSSGKHLLDLINDVLDLSKIEAGRIEPADDECDVVETVEGCIGLMQERIAKAGLHGKHEIDQSLPTMVLDERRLKQVILNLISNAVKFTPPGGTITVSAALYDERGVCISVRDTGIGMTEAEIPRALSKFGQIDGELSRQHDGTGLGLPIAKSLIEMHGGSLEIRSKKGKGTEVQVWLPPERIRVVRAA